MRWLGLEWCVPVLVVLNRWTVMDDIELMRSLLVVTFLLGSAPWRYVPNLFRSPRLHLNILGDSDQPVVKTARVLRSRQPPVSWWSMLLAIRRTSSSSFAKTSSDSGTSGIRGISCTASTAVRSSPSRIVARPEGRMDDEDKVQISACENTSCGSIGL